MNFMELRLARGYTERTRLAATSGVDEGAIRQIESGMVRSPRYTTVAKLAAALDTTAAEVAACIEAQYEQKRNKAVA